MVFPRGTAAELSWHAAKRNISTEGGAKHAADATVCCWVDSFVVGQSERRDGAEDNASAPRFTDVVAHFIVRLVVREGCTTATAGSASDTDSGASSTASTV